MTASLEKALSDTQARASVGWAKYYDEREAREVSENTLNEWVAYARRLEAQVLELRDLDFYWKDEAKTARATVKMLHEQYREGRYDDEGRSRL